VLQKNLTVIDQAITTARRSAAAVEQQRAKRPVRCATQQVALLQQTVELINEMRKGNQAEAGRRIQTLAQ
jgi:hypothetical protein